MPFFSPWWYLFWAFNKRHAWNQRGKGQPFILDEGKNQLLVSTQNNAHLHLLIWSQEGGHTLEIIIWDLWAKSHNEMRLLFICSFFWLKNFENSGKDTEALRKESWKYHWPPTWHQLLRYKYTHINFVGASWSETWTYQMLTEMSVPGSPRRLESVSWSNRTQLFRRKLFQVLHLSPRRSLHNNNSNNPEVCSFIVVLQGVVSNGGTLAWTSPLIHFFMNILLDMKFKFESFLSN